MLRASTRVPPVAREAMLTSAAAARPAASPDPRQRSGFCRGFQRVTAPHDYLGGRRRARRPRLLRRLDGRPWARASSASLVSGTAPPTPRGPPCWPADIPCRSAANRPLRLPKRAVCWRWAGPSTGQTAPESRRPWRCRSQGHARSCPGRAKLAPATPTRWSPPNTVGRHPGKIGSPSPRQGLADCLTADLEHGDGPCRHVATSSTAAPLPAAHATAFTAAAPVSVPWHCPSPLTNRQRQGNHTMVRPLSTARRAPRPMASIKATALVTHNIVHGSSLPCAALSMTATPTGARMATITTTSGDPASVLRLRIARQPRRPPPCSPRWPPP